MTDYDKSATFAEQKNTSKMKKLIGAAFLLSAFLVKAQIATGTSTTVGAENSKWTFGGYAGIGGAFGSGGGTTVYITPRVGYKLTEDFEAGIAGNFSWSNSSYYSSTMVGVGPFANYYFSRSFFLSGLFQEYFVNQKNKQNQLNYSGNEAALYLGGGYMQRVGERAYIQIGGMYNVLYRKDKSFLGSAFVPQVGVVFGL